MAFRWHDILIGLSNQQVGKIATVGLAPAVNGPIMNTTFSLIATWWGSKPVDDADLPIPEKILLKEV